MDFVIETSNQRRINVIVGTIIVLLVLLSCCAIFYQIFKDQPNVQQVTNHIQSEISSISVIGVFYVTFLGYLFFIPLPTEIYFYAGLESGNPFMAALIVSFAAIVVTQIFNYLVGMYFTSFFMNLISIKQIYKLRRWVNNYGVYAIFFINVTPGPASVLTFALGIIRYNTTKLAIAMFLGTVIKYALMFILFYARVKFL